MASSTPVLPSTMKSLVCDAMGEPMRLKDLPVPEALPGSAIVQVLAATVDANIPRILTGEMQFTFPTPFVPGSRAIGRVVALGPDATSLTPGKLVLVEPHVRARDDTDVAVLFGISDGYTPKSKKFMADAWRNGTYAEFVRVPLENTWALDEDVLCKQMGYTPAELTYLGVQIVTYGGFRSINLQPGETVLVSPATGMSSGAAVGVAHAMGANVIAVSRNLTELKRIQAVYPKTKIVATTGDVKADTAAMTQYGPIDAWMDISPPWAGNSTHLESGFQAIKYEGRVALMGVPHTNLPIPYLNIVVKNLTIKGQYMYERADVKTLIKLAEMGALKLGKEGGQEVVGQFAFADIEKALETANANAGSGKITVVGP